jgi:alpha-galactosidase
MKLIRRFFMTILFDKKNRIFHLKGGNCSYIFGVNKYDYLQHIYWGEAIKLSNYNNYSYSAGRFFDSPAKRPVNIVSLEECTRSEYPYYGTGDFKAPAFQTEDEYGYTSNCLKYKSYRIFEGKPLLDGLPATYMEQDNEGQTLEITGIDEAIGLEVVLCYSVFEKLNAIIRSVRFINKSSSEIKLLRALSMSVDMEDHDFDFMQLWGSWAAERNIDRKPLTHGIQALESRRGSSSHQKNPFVALLRKNADENSGEVFGFSFVYSGSFLAQIEVEQFDIARVSMGLNPFNFSWNLESGSVFQTPEVVMVYSNEGLGGMSRTYHKLYRERLCRGEYRDKQRPILVNNWEATYFNFDSEKILNIAEDAKELGIELLVLDDGWFGKRNNSSSSLGDWIVNLQKIPEGLKGLGNKMNELGLQFGLWFEPEMISPDSELYRVHPDWCIHIPSRQRTQMREQLVLDLSRQEVCEYIINILKTTIGSAPISYVKWDFNRELTEMGNEILPPHRQKEISHRFVLGLYKILDELTKEFPHVLFEGCASGGGRFDPGMLFYTPQIWTSDNTDAISRLFIQYGTSLVYPACTMGAHVSAVPNHQTGRNTPLETRGNVAMSGVFGYEMDLNVLNEEEKVEIKRQIEQYKNYRDLVQHADMYRLRSPYEGDVCAVIYVNEDKTEAFVSCTRLLCKAALLRFDRLKLQGLDKDKIYEVIGENLVLTGSELMKIGLDYSELKTDFASKIWILKSNNLYCEVN